MRTPVIAGNWKMYKTVGDAVKYVKEFRSLVQGIDDVEIVVAPTFVALHAAAEAARHSNVGVAAQDLYWERQGAFTGEVSAAMIADFRCSAGYRPQISSSFARLAAVCAMSERNAVAAGATYESTSMRIVSISISIFFR